MSNKLVLRLQNENKLDKIVTKDAKENIDYTLKEFNCRYKDKCDYNKEGMVYKCLGIARIEGDKNCILETTITTDNLPKDSAFYREKGKIGYAFYPMCSKGDIDE